MCYGQTDTGFLYLASGVMVPTISTRNCKSVKRMPSPGHAGRSKARMRGDEMKFVSPADVTRKKGWPLAALYERGLRVCLNTPQKPSNG